MSFEKISKLNKAIELRNEEEVSRLLKEFDKSLINSQALKKDDSEKKRPIDCCAESGSLKILELLIQQGADLNTVNSETGFYPIHLVVNRKINKNEERQECLQIVEKFKEQGVSFEVKTEDLMKHNPIHLIMTNGNFFLLEKLIEGGANINSINRDGKTPLGIARERGYVGEVIDMIISLGGTLCTDEGSQLIARYNDDRKRPDIESEKPKAPPSVNNLMRDALLNPGFHTWDSIMNSLERARVEDALSQKSMEEEYQKKENSRFKEEETPQISNPSLIGNATESPLPKKIKVASVTVNPQQVKSLVTAISAANNSMYNVLIKKINDEPDLERKKQTLEKVVSDCEASLKDLNNSKIQKNSEFIRSKIDELNLQIKGIEQKDKLNQQSPMQI